jgi:DNA-binding XRE family transcriptional regulator
MDSSRTLASRKVVILRMYHNVVGLSTTSWYYLCYNKENIDDRCLMTNKEFRKIRHILGRTQEDLARLLCVSPKAVQSFEQGWRKIPVSAERQMLFLLSLKRSLDKESKPCWEIRNCPDEWRKKCAAWELKAGNFCWFVNGTYCQGELQESWTKKLKLCRQCELLRSILPDV